MYQTGNDCNGIGLLESMMGVTQELIRFRFPSSTSDKATSFPGHSAGSRVILDQSRSSAELSYPRLLSTLFEESILKVNMGPLALPNHGRLAVLSSSPKRQANTPLSPAYP